METPDPRKLLQLFVNADQEAIIEHLAPEIENRPSLVYQNWARLMEAESIAAQHGKPVNHIQEVVLTPEVLTEFVPLFLARDDPNTFLDSHFVDCSECGETSFIGFHIAPTLPYSPATEEQAETSVTEEKIEKWTEGEKRISPEYNCPECGATLNAEIPPAIPPAAWTSWWINQGIAKVLHKPLKEKIKASRRFQVEGIEENIVDEKLTDLYDEFEETGYHIPLIVDDYEIGKVAIDVVRSLGADENGEAISPTGYGIRETLEQFNAVCEQREIREKIFIVIGTIPKSLRTDLADLKKNFFSQVTQENSKYRGIELHIISYPEELGLILNQRLYGRVGPGDKPHGAPRLYDLNAWEMELAGESFGEEIEPSDQEKFLEKQQLGTYFEYVVRELLEAKGYQIHDSDELDHSKVDLLCQREEGGTMHFRLVQCKLGSISESEISSIDEEFEKIEESIQSYWNLLTTTDIDRVVALGSENPKLEEKLSGKGYDIITLEDLQDNRDDINPSLRKPLGI